MKDILYLMKTKKMLFALLALGIILMSLSHFGAQGTTGGMLSRFFLHTSDCGEISSERLEERIAEVIKSTYSLEEVSVIITYDTSGEKIVEREYEAETGGKNTYSFGNNAAEPFVRGEKLPGVRGALVCAYPLSENLSYDIKNAVSTLLGVSVNRVSVIYKK